MRLTACFACIIALGVVAGCVPNSVTLSLGEGRDILRSTVVAQDEGAGQATVAMIDIRGLIADAPRTHLVGEEPGMVSTVVRRLGAAAHDEDIKAVILRINSPGGTVTGSDILYREIVRFRRATGKPVIASLGEVATSGGYYVALAADEIIAQPTSITASIGVLFPTINISEGLDKIGIEALLVTSGPHKAMADPLTPPREGDYEILQTMVDEMYARFRTLVVERRPGLDPESIDTVTDGRIMTGQDALAAGLVDATGGVRDAFERSKSLAGVEAARLIRFHTQREGPKTVYASEGGPWAHDAPGLLQITIGKGLAGFANPAPYYLWSPGVF